jgi:hypothetical protein
LLYDVIAPELERIDGVIIVVCGRDYLPPHIHAFHSDDEALENIRTGEIMAGVLPHKKLKIVQKWLADNKKRAEINFYELNPVLSPVNYKRKKKLSANKKRKNK